MSRGGNRSTSRRLPGQWDRSQTVDAVPPVAPLLRTEVSETFRIFDLGSRPWALVQAVMTPPIRWSFSKAGQFETQAVSREATASGITAHQYLVALL
jgi:hypothetical protein